MAEGTIGGTKPFEVCTLLAAFESPALPYVFASAIVMSELSQLRYGVYLTSIGPRAA